MTIKAEWLRKKTATARLYRMNMMWVDVAYERTGMNGKCLGVTLNIGAGISFGCAFSGKTKLCVIYHKNSQSKIKSLLTLKNIKKINIRFKRK